MTYYDHKSTCRGKGVKVLMHVQSQGHAEKPWDSLDLQ